MTVYLDEVFIVNFIMDWVILWITGNLAQCSGKRWRLAAAAFVGACYSIVIFFPKGQWLSLFPVKICCSFLMLFVAFAVHNLLHYFKLVIYFYFVSFLLCGASLASMFLFGQKYMQTWNGVALLEVDFHLFWLVMGVSLTSIAIYCMRGYLRRDLSATQQIVSGWIQFDEHTVSLKLLVDSGHCLTDPLSGNSVLLAERDLLLPLFSDSIQNILKQQQEGNESEILLALAQQQDMVGRWRLIPYRVVGNQGLLLGFRPDRIVVQDGRKERTWYNHIVALSLQKFSVHGTYQGLIPLELL